MRFRGTSYDNYEELKSNLYQARQTIISLMPEKIQDLFHEYYDCKSEPDTYRWERDVIEQIIQGANVIPGSKYSLCFNGRAYCPLCGAGSSSGYENGFSLPEGLSRHLRGWGDNRRCEVIDAALALAGDYWNSQLAKWEEEKKARTEERLKSETLFVTSRDNHPKLIEEGLSWHNARTPDSLALAEKRLTEIGFSLHSEANIKSYTQDRDNFLIIADPRAEGYIEFSIYKKPSSEGGPVTDDRVQKSILVYDRWKHDLRGKFDRLFAEFTTEQKGDMSNARIGPII